jgi:hypothetical protein
MGGGRGTRSSGELRQVYAVERLKKTENEGEALQLVEQYSLTYQMVPEQWTRSPAVWELLLAGLSYADLVRNLMSIASSGLLEEESPATALVVARLIDRRRAANSGLVREELARVRTEYARCPDANRAVIEALDFAGDCLLTCAAQ